MVYKSNCKQQCVLFVIQKNHHSLKARLYILWIDNSFHLVLILSKKSTMITKIVCVVFALISLFYISSCFEVEPKILNGMPSQRGQFPFYVYIQSTKRFANKSKNACGGTLLNEQFVLTAAHCVYNTSKSEVHLGSWQLWEYEEGRQVSYARARRVFIHPEYEPRYLVNDIALIKLRRPAVYSEFVQPVAFPNECYFPEGIFLTAIGNGLIDDTENELKFPSTLQFTTLVTTTASECRNIYKHVDDNSVFCAKHFLNKSICDGDSGGPIISPIDHTIFGLSSFRHPSKRRDIAQGFTNVLAYFPWISAMTGIRLPKCN